VSDVAADPVVFLIGAERSGTTMLRLMLDGHRALAFRYEFELAVDLVPDDGGWPDLAVFREWLRTYRFVDPPPEIDPTLDYPSLVRSFLEQKRRRDRKPRVGATVHRHYHRLLRIWPDAVFVHLVRDPRDVARSSVEMGWAGNTWTGATAWVEAEEAADRLRAELGPARLLDVRYEDLVRAPEHELARICAHVGLPYDSGMLDYPMRSSYRHPDPQRVERWRGELAPRDIQLVEARVGALLSVRGYPSSGLPPLVLSPVDEAALHVQCRLARARYSARTLGPGLWLARAVTERVGPKGWRDAVRLRIHERENAQLA
jgi:hypothetical protein